MEKNKITFDKVNHEFKIENLEEDSFDNIQTPLSLILQVTRRCNLKCNFCSESQQFKDPQFMDLISLIPKLGGVQRLYLSGGEPLIRRDIFELIEEFSSKFPILGLPTNTTKITKEVCKKLSGKVSYINAGLDGPRNINNLVRGGYNEIIDGLQTLRDNDIEVSLSSVVLKDTVKHLHQVVQIADVLKIVKVKMVIPILRGRASVLQESDFASQSDILDKFEEIKKLKETLGWIPRVKFTFWDKSTEGYALIVFPTFEVYAWPVYDQPDAVLRVGDLKTESISEIWKKYPYKINHIKKYTGITMHKT